MKLLIIIEYLMIWFPFTLILAQENEDTVGYAGMVASAHYLASEAGVNILKAGGTAADAAFAVQLVLNVVHPSGSGIGGGTFITYYDSDTDKVYTIDGREEAPNTFNPYVFCANITCFNSNKNTDFCDNCNAIPWDERRVGGLSIGVPGTIYSFKRLWDIFGKVSWPTLFKDAINIAGNGFIMYSDLYEQVVEYIPSLSRFNATCKMLLNYPDCDAPKYEIGDTVTFTDFASTLTTLSLNADDAIQNFYHGDIAAAIVDASQNSINPVTGRAGQLSMQDMEGYRAVFREPISSTVTLNNEQYDIYGANMPSSGSLTVQYQLKMLQYLQTNHNFNKHDLYSDHLLHYLFSAQNIAFADRDQYMADKDFVNVPISGIQNEKYLKQRAIDYLSETAQKLPIPFGFPVGWNETEQSLTQESGTAHMSIVDEWGNVASITTSIEWVWGSFVVLDGYGFFLNNQLTDFANVGIVNGNIVANGAEGGKKQRVSALDLFGSDDSESFGGKRPRSSMSPTIVFKNNRPYLIAGSEGGSTIIGTTFGIIARSLIYGISPQNAVNAPRVWGRNNARLELELSRWEDGNSDILVELISDLGYDPMAIHEVSQGNANCIKIDQDSAKIYCGADYTRWPTSKCVAVSTTTTTTSTTQVSSDSSESSESSESSSDDSRDEAISNREKQDNINGLSKGNELNYNYATIMIISCICFGCLFVVLCIMVWLKCNCVKHSQYKTANIAIGDDLQQEEVDGMEHHTHTEMSVMVNNTD